MADDSPEIAVPTSAGRRRRVAPFVAGGIAVVLATLFVILLTSDASRNETADSPLIGRLAPDSRGVLADGSTFELSRRQGSWVVLNFFTHNCIPCVREHPELIKFVDQQRALGAEGAEFYTVVRDSTREETEQFFAERGGDWPIVYEPDYGFSNAFGVSQVPETWIIDPSGTVRGRFISEVTADGLSVVIQRMRTGAS